MTPFVTSLWDHLLAAMCHPASPCSRTPQNPPRYSSQYSKTMTFTVTTDVVQDENNHSVIQIPPHKPTGAAPMPRKVAGTPRSTCAKCNAGPTFVVTPQPMMSWPKSWSLSSHQHHLGSYPSSWPLHPSSQQQQLVACNQLASDGEGDGAGFAGCPLRGCLKLPLLAGKWWSLGACVGVCWETITMVMVV
jgi:hypothetical protein